MKISGFPRRGDVYWVNLDPTLGTEINKKRPAVIISNNINNEFSSRVIVAPVTSKADKLLPFDVPLVIKHKAGKVVLDQLRSIYKIRLANKLDMIDDDTMFKIDIALKKVLALR